MEDYYTKPVKNEFQRRYLGEIEGNTIKPVLLNPMFVGFLNSLAAAVFLSQMLYWKDKGRNPSWIYKTIKEMDKETGLSRRQQDTAISKLIKLGILDKMLTRTIPPKRNFRIDVEILDNLFTKYCKGYEK